MFLWLTWDLSGTVRLFVETVDGESHSEQAKLTPPSLRRAYWAAGCMPSFCNPDGAGWWQSSNQDLKSSASMLEN